MNLFNIKKKKTEEPIFLAQINDTLIKEQQNKDNKKYYYLINTKTSNIIGQNEHFINYDIINNRYIVLLKSIPKFEIDSRMEIKDIEALKKTIFSKVLKNQNILYDTENEQIILNFDKRCMDISNLTFQTYDTNYHIFVEINNQLIEYIFEDIKAIDRNYDIVKKDNKFGIFNNTLGIVVPIQYENITFEQISNLTLCYTYLDDKLSCYNLSSNITKLFELEGIKLDEIKGYINQDKILSFKVRDLNIEYQENSWKFENEVTNNTLKNWLIKDIKDISIDNNNIKILHKGNHYFFVKGKWIKEEK